MSCQTRNPQPKLWQPPEWFDNLGGAYANSPVPGVRQLGKLMDGYSKLVDLENASNATSYSDYGKIIGSTVGSFFGGAVGVIAAIGTTAFVAPVLALGTIGTFALGTVLTGVLHFAGSSVFEEFYEYIGQGIGVAADMFEQYHNATDGSDPAEGGCDTSSGFSAHYEGLLVSPIVLDMDGDGVELIALEASSTLFDIDNDNFAEHIRRTGDSALHRLPAQAGVSPAQGAGLHP